MNGEEASNEFAAYLDCYTSLRNWQNTHMPIYGSFIGFDLILFLAKSRYDASAYSLKDVFHSLNYSEGALRIFIRRLEKEGWILLETSPDDRRNKKIIVTDQLLETVNDFFRQLMRFNLAHHEQYEIPTGHTDPAQPIKK